jgi:hypothetical protein
MTGWPHGRAADECTGPTDPVIPLAPVSLAFVRVSGWASWLAGALVGGLLAAAWFQLLIEGGVGVAAIPALAVLAIGAAVTRTEPPLRHAAWGLVITYALGVTASLGMLAAVEAIGGS